MLVADQIYLFNNPLDAVQSLYDFYNGLNIAYPSSSEQVWYIVGELLFEAGNKKYLNSSAIAVLSNLRK